MSASISSSGRRWPSLVIQGDAAARRRSPRRCVDWLSVGAKSVRRPVKRDWIAMCGKCSAVSELSVALQRGAEQHAGELADVARPAVAHQHRERVIADRQRLHARSARRSAVEQVAGERGNVAAAVAQRRQGDRRRADPLGKAGMEIVGQRPAAGGDDPDVDRMAAVEADRADFAGGEHAVEQLLGLGGKRADLVEQQRAAVGLDQLAGLGREGAREGALLVAEQLAVDDVGGDRLAVERRAAGPWRAGWRRGSRGRRFPCRCRARRRSGSAGGCGRPWRRRRARRGIRARRRPVARATASGASFSDTGASSPAARRRSALAASASSSRSGATGRTRKSEAPARIASTATETAVAVRQDDDRQVRRAARASAAISAGPVLGVPAAEQRRLDFAAVRALEQRRRAVSSSAAPTTLQPARAAMAEISRRSSASASSSNRERIGSSRIMRLRAPALGDRGKGAP